MWNVYEMCLIRCKDTYVNVIFYREMKRNRGELLEVILVYICVDYKN